MNLKLKTVSVGMGATNCYLLKNKTTAEIIIVDPGDWGPQIIREVKELQGTVTAILLTHGHFDHIMAVNEVKKIFPAKVYAAETEQDVLSDPAKNFAGSSYQVQVDVWVKDQEILSLAGFQVQVFSTPGHTAGSVCYYFKEEELILCGDTIFLGSYGRTDLPTGNMAQITKSVHFLLNTFSDTVKLYPGHGEPTTVAFEKRYNPLAHIK